MNHRPAVIMLVLIISSILAFPARGQQRPFTQDQVQGMVRAGLADESGAKLIEQRGIDFAPTDDFLQSLKTAGAKDAFLASLRAAKRPEPTSAKKPINQLQVITLLAGQVPSERIAMLVKERGIDFEPTDDYFQEVRLAGGDDEIIGALKNAKVTKPESIDQTLRARQADIRQHVVRATELKRKRQYAEAEQEYRAALLLDSQNDDLYVGLAYVLIEQNKPDDGASAAHDALRLNPNNEMAHFNLSSALAGKGDWDGAIAECREALRLNPNNSDFHSALGVMLGKKGDSDGEIAEYREALRLNPGNDNAHVGLGMALGGKGDQDGMTSEESEAIRLNPNNAMAHTALGIAFAGKGDRQASLEQCRIARELAPENAQVRGVCNKLAEGLKAAIPPKTEKTTTASTPTAPACAVPFTWAIMDWEDSQKMRWGFPEDGVYWWSSKGASKFPNLCFTQPDSASYVIVVRTRHFPLVNRGGDFEVEVFRLLHGEINTYPILWRSKFNDSIKLKFEQAVNYLAKIPSE